MRGESIDVSLERRTHLWPGAGEGDPAEEA